MRAPLPTCTGCVVTPTLPRCSDSEVSPLCVARLANARQRQRPRTDSWCLRLITAEPALGPTVHLFAPIRVGGPLVKRHRSRTGSTTPASGGCARLGRRGVLGLRRAVCRSRRPARHGGSRDTRRHCLDPHAVADPL